MSKKKLKNKSIRKTQKKAREHEVNPKKKQKKLKKQD